MFYGAVSDGNYSPVHFLNTFVLDLQKIGFNDYNILFIQIAYNY